ncbi:DEAD/DEAH box helicase [Sandaracinus amylolyticus]|uniref:Helicase, SNF2/RAD54 family n=1 Tax=Sandaracinus amylolyticus TaxID=927083 RepID=A0A0F6W2T2_9BACT|nr:DEAD/DEAH box helicase [Sandaracinus amylolyticus]AKF05973.1 Helicase, SNF2/RAD54 family [Sandaracinus amylolyticus]
MTDTHPELDDLALDASEGDGDEGYDDGPEGALDEGADDRPHRARQHADADSDGDADDGDDDDDGEDDDDEAPARVPDPSRVAQHVSRFSDRAIQRVVGGNAFLRGRQYARRGDVKELETQDGEAHARIHVKQDTYEPRLVLGEDNAFTSSCTCAGFRGPTQHCKHVAALLVALRDRERPPRPKAPQQDRPASSPPAHPKTTTEIPPGTSHTVSVGGKRRRSRRRRRGAETNGVSHLEVLTTREPGPAVLPPPGAVLTGNLAYTERPGSAPLSVAAANEARGVLDAWLPGPDEQTKPFDLEFRMQVRSASITITPVIAGTRTAVPITDALAAFHAVAGQTREIMRALARHTPRNTPATAELRAEDAAEVLSMLKDRRVLLEPASMELRFADDTLKPRIELDQANGRTCRVRVVFESKGGLRRFPLSSGAWFEGTPGWHVDTTEGIARPVAESVTPAWLQRLYRSPALIYPMGELPRLLGEGIPRVAASLGAELPDLSQVADLVDAAPRFKLQLDGDIIEARAKLSVYYGEQLFPIPPAEFPSPLAFLPPREAGGRPRVVRRDVGAEMSSVQQLMNLGFAVDETREGLVAKGDGAVSFWTNGITSLPESWEKLIPHDLRAVKVRDASVTAQVRVASGVDWLSLDMTFNAGGVAVDEDELRNALEKGRRLVKLSDGTFAPVKAEEVREVLDRMAEIVAGTSGGAKVPLSQAGRIQDLLRIVGNSSVSPQAKEILGKLEEIGEIEQIAKPRNLKVQQFRDYQKRGFSWLVFHHNLGTGGILADDMGLGKTLQTITMLLWLKNKTKQQKPTLVVAPTSVVPNWAREIEKFAPSLSTLIWQGPDRHEQRDEIEDTDVMITSYALLRRDEELLNEIDFRYVILDEAQHIKNPLSATARAAKKLKSERRLALTGTPIENRLSEIWSIIDFVSPGLLGSLKTFEEKYARPVERGDQETVAKLRAIIHPFVLRRTKGEVAPELPAKIEQEMIVPLADDQAKLYKQMLSQVRASVMSEVEKQGVGKAQIQILAALTRLRQAACDPRLTKMNAREGEWNDETSGKLSALREILQEAKAGGHRVLVFSQFVEMLQLIKSAADQDGIRYEYLDGSTKDRQDRVDHFNKDENVDAFLISLKAGGTGLNLTGADTVVHFDPWWNPAVEDQATDRAHRIGQTKVVTVYRLIAKGTVEEKILQLSDKKRELMSNVLTTESTPLKGLTKADIDELFSD